MALVNLLKGTQEMDEKAFSRFRYGTGPANCSGSLLLPSRFNVGADPSASWFGISDASVSICVQLVHKKAVLKGLKLDLSNAASTTDS